MTDKIRFHPPTKGYSLKWLREDHLHVICNKCKRELSDKECEDTEDGGGNWFCKECGNDAWVNGTILTSAEWYTSPWFVHGPSGREPDRKGAKP